MAAHCLRELSPDQPPTAAALLRATRDPDASVRRAALTSLAGVGADDPGIASRLAEVASQDSDPGSRALAERSLERIRSPQ
jgi:HEAT repeat protein